VLDQKAHREIQEKSHKDKMSILYRRSSDHSFIDRISNKDISVLQTQYEEVKQENDSNVKAREKLLEEAINRHQSSKTIKKNDFEEMKIAHKSLQGVQIMKLNLDNSEIEYVQN